MNHQAQVAFDPATHSLHGIDHRTPLDALIDTEDAAMKGSPHAATDEDAALLANCPPGILGALLRFILPPVPSASGLRVANYRLICLAHQCGIENVGNQSITDLAKMLGITKAALSYWNVRLCDELGEFRSRGGKSPTARENYRASAVCSHRARGNFIKADQ